MCAPHSPASPNVCQTDRRVGGRGLSTLYFDLINARGERVSVFLLLRDFVGKRRKHVRAPAVSVCASGFWHAVAACRKEKCLVFRFSLSGFSCGACEAVLSPCFHRQRRKGKPLLVKCFFTVSEDVKNV